MRLLIDMNLTPRWVQYLNEAGHNSVHWSSVGNAKAKDPEICDYAREHGYVLLTNDMDFPQILAHTRESQPSVILLRGEPLTPHLRGSAVLKAIVECQPELQDGAIVALDWTDQPRARVLPLR